MAITIKDIAKVAGVSHTTVSRALRGSRLIAEATATRIKQIADEMGYVPNSAARGLKTSRSNALGVIAPRIDDPFFSKVLDGIEDVLQVRGYSLFLASSGFSAEKDQHIIQSMAERRVDGVIICSKSIDQVQRAQLRSFGMPIVFVNEQSACKKGHSVLHDDVHGACVLAEYLVQIGHRKIAYIGNRHAGIANRDRLQGVEMALQAAGLALQTQYVVHGLTGQPDSGVEGVQKLLQVADFPTAIVCFNDMVAAGAIHALAAAGVRVPQDCSVTGFDDVALAAYLNPALTTLRQPMYELGQKSAEMVLNILQDASIVVNETVSLRGELVVRDSTAPPRA